MTWEEFREWQLFHAETPIDDLSLYHRPAAVIAQVFAESRRDAKKNPKAFELRDFMPPWQDLCDGPAETSPDLAAKLDQVVDLVNT